MNGALSHYYKPLDNLLDQRGDPCSDREWNQRSERGCPVCGDEGSYKEGIVCHGRTRIASEDCLVRTLHSREINGQCQDSTAVMKKDHQKFLLKLFYYYFFGKFENFSNYEMFLLYGVYCM